MLKMYKVLLLLSMNKSNKWLHEDLLPKLTEPTIIILAKASYDSTILEKTSLSSKKDEMKGWLRHTNIDFP